MCLEDGEDDVLLARARKILQAQGFAELDEFGCRTGLELRQVHDVLALFELLRWDYLETAVVIRIFVVIASAPTAAIRRAARTL
jgi:hypothetical protein